MAPNRPQRHEESLEEEATHVTDEARMILPGVQAIMGFQLIAVFNQRFQELTSDLQVWHLTAFLLLTVAMALIMTPAAYHRQAERGRVTRRFVDLASLLLMLALAPLAAGLAIDAYLLTWLVLSDRLAGVCVTVGVLLLLVGLWFVLPQAARPGRHSRPRDSDARQSASDRF